jgi:heterodisulfide reductase subunit C
MATGIRKVTARKVAEEIWRRMAARCIECGGCSFVCPMCTCFDVADLQESGDCGRRERSWDCCQYAGYSREASGFNPRPDKTSRFKRRFHHKLSYFNLLADGVHGCVGCGRCVQTCFGEVDMPAVVNAIRTETMTSSRA